MLAPACATQSHATLMQRFCSLGENCELGIAQRKLGAEPPDLLRWAWTDVAALARLLGAGCAGIGDASKLRLRIIEGNYFVRHQDYGFEWHSLIRIGQMPADEVLRREVVRMPRLAETFLADIGEAARIFVFKRALDPVTRPEAEAVLAALAAHGEPTLMYVTGADAAHPGGSVAWIAPRLLHGRIDRFADTYRVAEDTPVELWRALCAEAARLVDEQPSR
jgi:hypothetical protein